MPKRTKNRHYPHAVCLELSSYGFACLKILAAMSGRKQSDVLRGLLEQASEGVMRVALERMSRDFGDSRKTPEELTLFHLRAMLHEAQVAYAASQGVLTHPSQLKFVDFQGEALKGLR